MDHVHIAREAVLRTLAQDGEGLPELSA